MKHNFRFFALLTLLGALVVPTLTSCDFGNNRRPGIDDGPNIDFPDNGGSNLPKPEPDKPNPDDNKDPVDPTPDLDDNTFIFKSLDVGYNDVTFDYQYGKSIKIKEVSIYDVQKGLVIDTKAYDAHNFNLLESGTEYQIYIDYIDDSTNVQYFVSEKFYTKVKDLKIEFEDLFSEENNIYYHIKLNYEVPYEIKSTLVELYEGETLVASSISFNDVFLNLKESTEYKAQITAKYKHSSWDEYKESTTYNFVTTNKKSYTEEELNNTYGFKLVDVTPYTNELVIDYTLGDMFTIKEIRLFKFNLTTQEDEFIRNYTTGISKITNLLSGEKYKFLVDYIYIENGNSHKFTSDYYFTKADGKLDYKLDEFKVTPGTVSYKAPQQIGYYKVSKAVFGVKDDYDSNIEALAVSHNFSDVFTNLGYSKKLTFCEDVTYYHINEPNVTYFHQLETKFDMPDDPNNVTIDFEITDIKSDSATYEVTAHNGYVIDGVELYEEGKIHQYSGIYETTFRDLKPNTNYTVFIYYKNKTFSGTGKLEYTFKTPSKPVREFSFNKIEVSESEISYSIDSSGISDYPNYELTVTLNQNTWFHEDSTKFVHTFTNLTQGNNYKLLANLKIYNNDGTFVTQQFESEILYLKPILKKDILITDIVARHNHINFSVFSSNDFRIEGIILCDSKLTELNITDLDTREFYIGDPSLYYQICVEYYDEVKADGIMHKVYSDLFLGNKDDYFDLVPNMSSTTTSINYNFNLTSEIELVRTKVALLNQNYEVINTINEPTGEFLDLVSDTLYYLEFEYKYRVLTSSGDLRTGYKCFDINTKSANLDEVVNFMAYTTSPTSITFPLDYRGATLNKCELYSGGNLIETLNLDNNMNVPVFSNLTPNTPYQLKVFYTETLGTKKSILSGLVYTHKESQYVGLSSYQFFDDSIYYNIASLKRDTSFESFKVKLLDENGVSYGTKETIDGYYNFLEKNHTYHLEIDYTYKHNYYGSTFSGKSIFKPFENINFSINPSIKLNNGVYECYSNNADYLNLRNFEYEVYLIKNDKVILIDNISFLRVVNLYNLNESDNYYVVFHLKYANENENTLNFTKDEILFI